LSTTLLFGTGIGSAFYMLFASQTRDPRATAVVARYVVMADWLFTTPTIILQPLTGLYLIHLAGFPATSKWITHSALLYALGVACWLPVVWLQIRMKTFAREAVESNAPLPAVYWRYMTWWVLLGIPAFFAFVFVFYLMVAKPA
jgi:uncharacterized membrane protein